MSHIYTVFSVLDLFAIFDPTLTFDFPPMASFWMLAVSSQQAIARRPKATAAKTNARIRPLIPLCIVCSVMHGARAPCSWCQVFVQFAVRGMYFVDLGVRKENDALCLGVGGSAQ